MFYIILHNFIFFYNYIIVDYEKKTKKNSCIIAKIKKNR